MSIVRIVAVLEWLLDAVILKFGLGVLRRRVNVTFVGAQLQHLFSRAVALHTRLLSL